MHHYDYDDDNDKRNAKCKMQLEIRTALASAPVWYSQLVITSVRAYGSGEFPDRNSSSFLDLVVGR